MSSLRERMMPRPDEDNPDRPSKGYFIEGSDPDNSIVIAVNVKQLHDSVQTTKKLENLNWESVKFLGRIFKENNGLMPMIHLKVDTDHDPQSGTTPKISIMEGHHRLRLLSERGSEETTLVYVTLSDYNDEDALQKAADIVKQTCGIEDVEISKLPDKHVFCSVELDSTGTGSMYVFDLDSRGEYDVYFPSQSAKALPT